MDLDAKTLMHAPCALMVVTGALKPLACSRKGFSVFGLRAQRVFAVEDLDLLGQALSDESDLSSELIGSMDRLRRPGADAQFRWVRKARTYEVIVGSLERGEDRRFLVMFQDVTQQIPTRVIWGKQDPFIPLAYAHRIGDDVRMLEDCGHWVPLVKPDVVAEEVRRFQVS